MRVAGKTHCQGHSRPALGYFLPKPTGELDPARDRAGGRARAGPLDGLEVRDELGHEDGGQRGRAVLVALTRAHGDLVAREVDVLYADANGLEEAEPGSVQQDGDETVGSAELADDGADLIAR